MKHLVRTVVSIAVSAAALAFAGCNDPVAATPPKAAGNGNGDSNTTPANGTGEPVSDANHTPEPATSARTTVQPARIEPFEQAPLYAKIDGYVRASRTVSGDEGQPVDASLADIGDRVNEGDVLAEIWVPEMEKELLQKHALHAQAEAEVELAAQVIVVAQKAAESARARISEAEAGVVRAGGEYERWKAERDRIQQLAASGSVSQKLADETLNQFRAAEAARLEAAAQIESTKAAHGEAEANVAKAKADAAAANARLQVAQANVDHMQTLLGYSKIRAPFRGIVTERNVDTGHLVRPPQGSGSQPLFVVARTDLVRIVTDVPELDAPLVHVRDRAFVSVQALGGEEIEGRVSRTAWVLDPSSRTLRTEIDLPSPSGRLRPGMYAKVRIVLEDASESDAR